MGAHTCGDWQGVFQGLTAGFDPITSSTTITHVHIGLLLFEMVNTLRIVTSTSPLAGSSARERRFKRTMEHYHSSVCAILTGGSRYRGIPRFRSPVSNIVVHARYLGRAPISCPRADIV